MDRPMYLPTETGAPLIIPIYMDVSIGTGIGSCGLPAHSTCC